MQIYCIHALDETTSFLSVFKELTDYTYLAINPDDKSISDALEKIQNFESNSVVLFLGHGHTNGLYSPEDVNFKKRIIINSEIADRLFRNQNVLLLSCNSSEFIKTLKTFKSVIGFGNIISSLDEVRFEAEITGVYRDLSKEDIENFNAIYINSIVRSLELLVSNKIKFNQLPFWISFYLNEKIISIIRQPEINNRLEICKLMYEFKNEMRSRQGILV